MVGVYTESKYTVWFVDKAVNFLSLINVIFVHNKKNDILRSLPFIIS